ncbi:hypothetical protein [Microbulbifer variabilis]|uniref:hypothetical protein n=1 Tax=Microbulbifer variabilis TaxID=266805 RepID=UPI001CFCAB3B|nr:hypothetical protein [Microbulbifer variabilis]
MAKFTGQFFGGGFTGLTLGMLFALALFIPRLDSVTEYGHKHSEMYGAALHDIEELKKVCGDECSSVKLGHEVIFDRYYRHRQMITRDN